MTDSSTIGFLMCKIHLKRIKQLEKEKKILIGVIKKELPEYTGWIKKNFEGEEYEKQNNPKVS